MVKSNINNAKRVVIKVGTNVLRNDDGEIALSRIYSFIEDISRLVKSGREVILVTSGAVGLGKKRLGLDSTEGVAIKQACAAIGQGKLMSIYSQGFDTFGVIVAQILLTEDDFHSRKKYLSLRTTLTRLLQLGVVPIINQNDTVSTIELDDLMTERLVCFSDNDKLSALVASELDADLMVLLSDIDGLYNDNPKTNPDAKIIRVVPEVNDEILSYGTDASEGGRGGMKTKLQAAQVVTRSGGTVIITNGKIPYIIGKIFNNDDVGTVFLPNEESLSRKKRWIGYATNIIGKIQINAKAKEAIIDKKKSLLPVGVTKVINDFKQAEVVSILDESGEEIARGMVNYPSEDIKKIIGCHSDDIMKILGYKNYDAVITRDNITIL